MEVIFDCQLAKLLILVSRQFTDGLFDTRPDPPVKLYRNQLLSVVFLRCSFKKLVHSNFPRRYTQLLHHAELVPIIPTVPQLTIGDL
jgi:hypothetical protein